MASRVDANLAGDLKPFGLEDSEKCFSCGHCTAICGLTGEEGVFPRKAIKYVQLGLRRELEGSVEPWLCYYCGDCTTHCPRDAQPAAQMMAFRRYLSSVYDWTGLSRRFYTSKAWELGAIGLLAGLVVAIFVVFHSLYPGAFTNELAVRADGTSYVPLNSFAPIEWVHLADWIVAGLLGALLLSNAAVMHRKILGGGRSHPIPLKLYLKKLWVPVVHFLTQKQFQGCETSREGFRRAHLLLMSGYILMFLLVVVLLPSFQIDEEGINWTTFVGYYATVALMAGLIYFAVGRAGQKEEIHRKSHFSDWLFLILLGLTVVTGIAVHLLRFHLLAPVATYVTYVIHLAVAVPMLLVEVPFGKWAHLLYRPLAEYLATLKVEAAKDGRSEARTARASSRAAA